MDGSGDSQRVLLVGGAGYVGSHTARECRRAGLEPVIFDNYSTGNTESVRGMETITGDLLDARSIRSAFENFRFDAVFHFAASCSVPESIEKPAHYYRNNVGGTLNLIHEMLAAGVERLIFSSTAAVYGEPIEIPIPETHDTHPVSPYARSKLLIEQMLADIAATEPLRYTSLRYVNAAGADPVGDIGEDHRNEEHLVPRLLLSAARRDGRFRIHGVDFDTPDGSAIRDDIHVNDIATAHILALRCLDEYPNEIINLGSNEGYSVKEVVQEAQTVVDVPLQAEEGERRPGDTAVLVASNDKAKALLDWRPQFSDLRTILETAWNWHRHHPQGYSRNSTTSGARQDGSQALFGDLAIRMGYATEDDVRRVLERQRDEMERGNQHKLMGMHMLEMGLLSTSQLIEILKRYER